MQIFYYFQNLEIQYLLFMYYTFVEFIMSLYNILINYFAWYKAYMIWRTSFNKFSDVLPAFTRASAIGNLWNICLGANFLSCRAKFEERSVSCVSFKKLSHF